MEEKERYELNDNDCIIDNEKNMAICDVCDVSESPELIVDLLNKQDKRIKKLGKMNNRLSQGIYWGNGEHFCDVVSKLKKENQQLKQQLHDLPKKIVGEIKNNCWYGGALLEDNYYKVTNKLLDTILKKYGGENESK